MAILPIDLEDAQVLDTDLLPPVSGDGPSCLACSTLIKPLRPAVMPVSRVAFPEGTGYLCGGCRSVVLRAHLRGYSNRAALLIAKNGLNGTTKEEILAQDKRVKEGELEDIVFS